MMDASQCDSKRSGWQGLTAGRRTALGASVAAVSAAAMVAATMVVVAVFAAVAALVSRRLTAGLAVTGVALIPLRIASASAPAAAAAILALLGIFPLAAGLAGGLGLRRGGGSTAEELFHPLEEAA